MRQLLLTVLLMDLITMDGNYELQKQHYELQEKYYALQKQYYELEKENINLTKINHDLSNENAKLKNNGFIENIKESFKNYNIPEESIDSYKSKSSIDHIKGDNLLETKLEEDQEKALIESEKLDNNEDKNYSLILKNVKFDNIPEESIDSYKLKGSIEHIKGDDLLETELEENQEKALIESEKLDNNEDKNYSLILKTVQSHKDKEKKQRCCYDKEEKIISLKQKNTTTTKKYQILENKNQLLQKSITEIQNQLNNLNIKYQELEEIHHENNQLLQNILNIIKEHGFDINEFNIVLFINQTLLEFKSLQKAPDGLCFIQVLCTILDQIKQSHHDQYLTIEYVKQKLQDIDKKSRKPLFTNKNLEILFIGIGKMLEERTNPYGIPSSSSVLIDILETKSDEFEKQIICLKKDNTELKSLVIEGNNKIKTYESKIFNSKQRIEEQQTKIQCLTTENIQLNLKILMFTNNNRKDNQ